MLAVEKDGFRPGRCKLCGGAIVWAVNDTGSGGGKIPLDAIAPTFAVAQDKPARKKQPHARRHAHNAAGDTILVSHFSTCPAKTKAYELLDLCARLFRNAGDGVYPTNDRALELMREVRAYLKMEGPP